VNLGAPELLIILIILVLPLALVGVVVLVSRTATGRRCGSCRAMVPPGQRFCGQCGTPQAA
jgi:predicted amidophosphoribosyltransferase